jgi:hypothetical protein
MRKKIPYSKGGHMGGTVLYISIAARETEQMELKE